MLRYHIYIYITKSQCDLYFNNIEEVKYTPIHSRQSFYFDYNELNLSPSSYNSYVFHEYTLDISINFPRAVRSPSKSPLPLSITVQSQKGTIG